MGKTQHLGLNKFGSEGRISDEGYKFSLRDRELIDSILYTLINHDHRAVSSGTLSGPPTGVAPLLTVTNSGGTLAAGKNYYYKVSYVDANGNETEASPASFINTPDAIAAPDGVVLTTATTGGSLIAGTYKYALAYYQDAGGVTTAPNISTIVVPSGTSTNTVTIPLPTLPEDADGWRIYRRGPGDLEYWYLDQQAGPATQYVDDGSISPDCTKKRPTKNTTNGTNKITIDLPPSYLPLDSRVTGWRIYRTAAAGSYSANSLVATVVETTTEGGADLVTTYDDTGAALSAGIPLAQTAVPTSVPQLDASSIFGSSSERLPPALAPLGVRTFNLLIPGTLAVQDYHQIVPPFDMLAERIDGFYLTAPTGLSAGVDYLTLRFSDNATQNEIQSLYNDATTDNEIQTLYNNATAGTFTLGDGVDTTSSINFDATAATIETRLETDIASITDVTVTGSGVVTDPWVIEWINPGGTNVTQLTPTDSLTGGTSTITTTIEGNDGGTFTLSDGTDTTSAIAYNAAAATVETRLQTDITSITDVTVTGTGTSADPWIIEFVNPGAQDVDLLIVSDTSLNGTSTINEDTEGYGNTQVDLVINQNQQAHNWQSATTDAGSQEAENATAIGGTQVSDTLATNDVAMELDAQNESNLWQPPLLEPGSYRFNFWVADTDQASTFDVRMNEVTAETQSVYNNSTTGDFTLTYSGPPNSNSETTAAIAYNAAASVVKAALELLPSLNTVTVTGAGTSGDPWLITFDDPAGNPAQLTANDTGMDGTSTIATDTAGTSSVLTTLTVGSNRPVYEPVYELKATLDGTQIVQFETIKTDATANKVRVDKYSYALSLPTLKAGSTVTVEVLVTGTPTTNGDDLQVTLWY